MEMKSIQLNTVPCNALVTQFYTEVNLQYFIEAMHTIKSLIFVPSARWDPILQPENADMQHDAELPRGLTLFNPGPSPAGEESHKKPKHAVAC